MDEFDVSALHYTQVFETPESDRLSELPDLLLLVILSLLPMRDVVRTTILSKRWKNLWTSVPCLDFWYELSRDFICGALAQWKGAKIHKFSMRFFYSYLPCPNDLQSWLLFAIEKRVEELLVQSLYNGYRAPQRLYSCSSITKLSICYCKLKIEENVIVQWNQLKSLTIQHSKPMRADVMTKLLSGAPVLEELVLCINEIKENLDIRSTSLKMLHIGRYDEHRFSGRVRNAVLRIRAPNLLSLEISASFYGDNCLLDVPSLANAILHFQMHFFEVDSVDRFSHLEMFNGVFRSICHVEKVTLSAWCTEFLVDLKKKDMVVPFSNAKSLQLYASTAEEILHVLEMFPMLTMLNVTRDNGEFQEPITAEEIHAAMLDACNSSVHKMTSLPTPSLLQLKTVEITWSLVDARLNNSNDGNSVGKRSLARKDGASHVYYSA